MDNNDMHSSNWRKSSYSNSSGECVEIGTAPWRKSTHSNGAGECLEAGATSTAVLIRDTKDHGTGPALRVTPADWTRFTTTIL